MDILKLILTLVISLVFGFGFWYLIFWFLTNEPNLFLWHWVTKIFYLLLSFSTTTGSAKNILEY
jgi:hypothetical protein